MLLVGTKRRSRGSPRGASYYRWREQVLARDGYRCQFPKRHWADRRRPKCLTEHDLQAHHVKGWARHPHLRHEPDNGLTYCRPHHARVDRKHRGLILGKRRVLPRLVRLLIWFWALGNMLAWLAWSEVVPVVERPPSLTLWALVSVGAVLLLLRSR